jgi:hypothetical protein
LWVDDLFLVGPLNACDKFTTAALEHFDSRDLGEARWLLGMAIQRDKNEITMTLTHAQMIENMITRHGLEACKPAHLPMEPNQSVGPDPNTTARRHVQELLTQVQTDLNTTAILDPNTTAVLQY